ncbi:HD domain-containing protein [Agathobaculum sp. NTUH-O15-33]|uniref:CCA tRNA nucleotidyltransferase n=1 Tax=Agathobaculum sp. NTUH-O15-33 TaxID=3079302 RepID=UPI002958801B|nr:HD domain-containing protein [Agathobaculum sp. NTUH-O15-33]WNX86664.1 HD domain-containing protein [Agathobaculum sp. NTUH-O15-33]
MTLPAGVLRALQKLEARGYEAWAVGGCVRDSLRGRRPHDYDLCTAASPAEMREVFAGERVLDTGAKHGTLTVLTDSGPVEITAFRIEGAYSDGRRPDEVRFVREVTADLARRDFTVNAMAWHPERGLCDPFGGQADLKNGLLRAVGDPDARFAEDALRILRAVRFAAKTGFTVQRDTAHAMRRQRHRLNQIAHERVREELTRLLCGRFVCRALMAFSDVLIEVLPELAPMPGCAQQNPHHLYNVWEHSVLAVGQVPAEPVLRLSALLHDCGKPACKTVDENGVGHFYGHPAVSRVLAEQIVRRLRFSKDEAESVLFLVEHHDRPLGDSDKLIRRRLAQIGEKRFRELLMIKKGDAVGQGTHPEDVAALLETERLLENVLAAEACFSLRQLAVKGNDMIALGLAGPAVGDMLDALLGAVIDGFVPNERNALLFWARDRMEERL